MERLGLGRLLTPAMRMTVRNMERRPVRALLTTFGIASAMAIIMSGMFWRDAIDYMIDVQFDAAQPADAEVVLVEPQDGARCARSRACPGCSTPRARAIVPVRLVAGHRCYRTGDPGHAAGSELRRPLDADLQPDSDPAGGHPAHRPARRAARRQGRRHAARGDADGQARRARRAGGRHRATT